MQRLRLEESSNEVPAGARYVPGTARASRAEGGDARIPGTGDQCVGRLRELDDAGHARLRPHQQRIPSGARVRVRRVQVETDFDPREVAFVQGDVRRDPDVVAVVELLEIGHMTDDILSVRRDLLNDELDRLAERPRIKVRGGPLRRRDHVLRCRAHRGLHAVRRAGTECLIFYPELDRQRATVLEADEFARFHVPELAALAHGFHVGEPEPLGTHEHLNPVDLAGRNDRRIGFPVHLVLRPTQGNGPGVDVRLAGRAGVAIASQHADVHARRQVRVERA